MKPLQGPVERFGVRACFNANLGTVWRVWDRQTRSYFVTCTGAKHYYSEASARESAANLNS